MKTDKELEEKIKKILHPDNNTINGGGCFVNFPKAVEDLISLFHSYALEIIGEDEKDNPDIYELEAVLKIRHERNLLRAEQRKKVGK